MSNILILGANSSVADALITKLIDQQHQVFLIARDEQRLGDLAERHQAASAAADCADFLAVDQAVKVAQEQLGNFSAVVNCCGSLLLKPAHMVSQLELEQTLQANLYTAFSAIRAAVKLFDAESGGSVALVSSAAAQIGLANHSAISAAKAAVEGLVLASAATYAKKNIRINAVAPGLTETNLTAKIFENKGSLDYSAKLHGLERFGQPADIAAAISFLLSEEASWVTGQILNVDGGLGTLKA